MTKKQKIVHQIEDFISTNYIDVVQLYDGKNKAELINNKYIIIYIKNKYKTIISKNCWNSVKKYKWYFCEKHTNIYIQHSASKTKLHHLVLNNLENKQIDHKNRNGLDNRLENLRTATPAENNYNKEKIKGKSKYKGVSKNRKGWRAIIYHKGIKHELGTFSIEEDAAKAYNYAAKKYFGEFAFINLIDGLSEEKCVVETKASNTRSITGYRGVRLLGKNRRKRYISILETNNEPIFLGTFLTAKEAALSYDSKAKEVFGEKAKLNFPRKLEPVKEETPNENLQNITSADARIRQDNL